MQENLGLEQIEHIEGVVEAVVFENKENGYAVFRINREGRRGRLTTTTQSGAPLVGQKVLLTGAFVEHPRFGRQFRADYVETVAPTDSRGIENFLASGAIDGIGEAMAHRIVEKFGEDSLKILEQHPNRLLEVQGIGKKSLEKIVASWNKNSELRDIMIFLGSHQISGTFAGRIHKEYGAEAMEVMQEDPYRLAHDIDGIGFLTADRMAEKLGFDGVTENSLSFFS